MADGVVVTADRTADPSSAEPIVRRAVAKPSEFGDRHAREFRAGDAWYGPGRQLHLAAPDDVASSLGQHTKDEIVALIEAVLEVRALGPDRRIPAERAALPASLQRPDDPSA